MTITMDAASAHPAPPPPTSPPPSDQQGCGCEAVDLTFPTQEQVLLTAIHLAALQHTDQTDCALALAPALNALSRTSSPALTKAALCEMPWIDMDLASKLGDISLLDLMLVWSRCSTTPGYRRPAQYTANWSDTSALALAARHGHLHVLEWWFDQVDELPFDPQSTRFIEAASRGGHMHILAWIESRLCASLCHPRMQLEACDDGKCVPETNDQCVRLAAVQWWHRHFPTERSGHVLHHVHAAMRAGHLDILRWWHALSSLKTLADCLDVRYAVDFALTHGYLDVLDWLVSQEPKVDLHALVAAADDDNSYQRMQYRDYSYRRRDRSITLIGLVNMVTGHQHAAMDWWASKQLPLGDNLRPVLSAACKSNNLAALEWLAREYAENCRAFPVNDVFANDACGSGHLDVVRWMIGNPVFAAKLDSAELNAALRNAYAGDPYSPSYWDPFFGATKGGHAHVLDSLHTAGGYAPVVVDFAEHCRRVLDCAGSKASAVQMLQWWAARIPDSTKSQIGPFEPEQALVHASMCGDIEHLDWWMQHGYLPRVNTPLKSLGRAVKAAAANGHVCVLKWWMLHFRDQVRGRPTKDWIEAAVATGQVSVLEWWAGQLDGLAHVVEAKLFQQAASNGQLAVLQWLHNKFPHSSPDVAACTAAIDKASAFGYTHILDWWLSESKWPFAYTHQALEPKRKQGYLSYMWWVRRGFKFSGSVVEQWGNRTSAMLLDTLMTRLRANVYTQSSDQSPFGNKFDVFAEVAREGHVAELVYLRNRAGYCPRNREQAAWLAGNLRERDDLGYPVQEHAVQWLEKQFGLHRVED